MKEGACEKMTMPFRIGLPRMHKEPGEKRDFLPRIVSVLDKRGVSVFLEHGYGTGMGFDENAYTEHAHNVKFVSHRQAYEQDYVLVLRCPTDEEIGWMRPGSCLISMLHYPTRPQRVEFLQSKGLECISLDSIKDDSGRRLIENLRSVAWNGVEFAFKTLRKTYPPPGLDSPDRPAIQVTLLGAGAVGSHVMQAAVHYGDDHLRNQLIASRVRGVKVTAIDYDLTWDEEFMKRQLAQTDILVDATQRPDATKAVIPNKWIAFLPHHAVILDLSVDPYDCTMHPPQLKGIEGVPQGNLDQFIFAPDDPAFDSIPKCVGTEHRRHTVSCYSWPGVYPEKCMQVYGKQVQPILRKLMEKGIQGIQPHGTFFERAIARAQLSRLGKEHS
jgi:alanine dehydrogenase